MTTRRSIEKEIEAHVADLVRRGLVDGTKWKGKPLHATPIPRKRGIWYDAAAVEKKIEFFRLLKQIKGRWAGKEFHLLDFQVRWLIAPVFGIKRADGLRLFRTAWFEIPRKNGKSTICSGLALNLAFGDREPGAEVYAAAAARDQARIVFEPARQMALGSPRLAKKLGKGLTRHYLEHPTTHSIFRALSADADLQHGLNVHGAIIDEVHVHKSPDLIDVLETGTGSREQPLVIFITTADDGADGSIYATKRDYLERIESGTLRDETFWGVVFGVDHEVEGFDPFSKETIAAANPGAGITVTWDYLLQKANEAAQSPSQLNRYLRLHLNVRTKQTVRWLPIEKWDRAAGLDPCEVMRGRRAWVGLDLSATTDFTAAAIVTKNGAGGYLVRPLFWVPEDRIETLEQQTAAPLRQWVREGWLRTTEGDVVDYSKVRADLIAECARLGLDVAEIAYDPWNATETVVELEKAGYTMVQIRQGYASLTAPCKEIERCVFGSTEERSLLQHGGHPVLRWHADCVEVRQDENGNLKPSKPDRRKSAKRIDGIAALVNGIARAMVAIEKKRSAYETSSLSVV